MLPRALRDRRIRFLVLAGAFFGVGLAVETWLIPHYAAPFAAGIYVILLQCMRHLRAAGARNRSGGLVWWSASHSVALCLGLAVLCVFAAPLKIGLPGAQMLTAYPTAPLGLRRANALAEIEQHAGGQLAIVRYAPGHEISEEWVFNAADIDHSKVVWARDMDSAGNRDLLTYFKDRQAWLVEPDFNPPRISPYPVDPEQTVLSSALPRSGASER